MDQDLRRGSRVIVRTFGDFPAIRKLWIAGPWGSVVAEDGAYERLLQGDISAGAALPTEDVFRFDAAVASELDPAKPFTGWSRLTGVLRSG